MAPLVSVGGTPLTVHGYTQLKLQLRGRDFLTDMVVVSSPTSEAILGVDFLQAQPGGVGQVSRVSIIAELAQRSQYIFPFICSWQILRVQVSSVVVADYG